MSAERVRVTFVHRCGEIVLYTEDPSRPYRIAQQRYTKADGRSWVDYGLVPAGDPEAALIRWATPGSVRVWRWAQVQERPCSR